LVARGWHWYSDLPLAIALGYQFGNIAAHPEGVELLQTNKRSLSVLPTLALDGAGVMVSLQF
jgi:hypothetical protein